MSAHTKKLTIAGLTEIRLAVPGRDASRFRKAIVTLLELLGDGAKLLNEDGEELYTREEVFPESSPGNRLRGLRTREGLTQKEFAKRLGILQHHVSEMEKGTRTITVEMAKRFDKTFDIDYRVFL